MRAELYLQPWMESDVHRPAEMPWGAQEADPDRIEFPTLSQYSKSKSERHI